MLSYFYGPGMFIYRWSSNIGEKVVLERAWWPTGDATSCPLPCVLYCMEGEFEQIITKIHYSVKDNNN